MTITENKIQDNYSLSDGQMKKIRYTISKRHSVDHWINTRRNVLTNTIIRDYDLEAVDWIVSVYFRDKKINWLDSEIEFTVKHIKRLEEELNYHGSAKIEFQDITLYSLAKTLKISYSNLKSKITNYEETNSVMVLYKNSDDVLCVKGNYIATLSGRHIKAYKYSLLNHYKKQLQELKRQQRGNN